MQYLEKDRTKFLEFWWKHIGDQLDKSLCKAPNGLSYKVIEIDEKKIILITLPTPILSGEAYFLACVKLPEKRVPFVNFSFTRVISFDKSEDENGLSCTRMAYLTPGTHVVPIGIGPQPDAEVFLAEVRRLLKI